MKKRINLLKFFQGKKLLLGVVAVICLFTLVCITFVLYPFFGSKETKSFTIPLGASAKQTSLILEKAEVLPFPYLFVIFTVVFDYAGSINGGDYEINKKFSLLELLNILQTGRQKDVVVKIIEGLSAKQIFKILRASNLKNSGNYKVFFNDLKFIASNKLSLEAKNLEGFLFPDTYHFSKFATEEQVLKKIIANFHKKIASLAKNQDYSPYELLILASIIEKETSVKAEKKIVASVFFNRLEKNIRLQTDPTVIYGIKNFNGNLTKKHLNELTPYNTYRIRALPPTPISNPGIDAIEAAYFPAQTDFLYFVGKGNGRSHFSVTLKEHNRAVLRYQKRRNKNYKSYQ